MPEHLHIKICAIYYCINFLYISGERNGNLLQYSCLENPTDRGRWWAADHGITRVGRDLATKPPPHFFYTSVKVLH